MNAFSCIPRLLRAYPPTVWAATRSDVFLPSLRQPLCSLWHRLSSWLVTPGARQALLLLPIRRDFVESIADMKSRDVSALRARIRLARTLNDLWHLRADVYRAVALHHSQAEADGRLRQLNQHFPTRAPRSGFIPLLP